MDRFFELTLLCHILGSSWSLLAYLHLAVTWDSSDVTVGCVQLNNELMEELHFTAEVLLCKILLIAKK